MSDGQRNAPERTVPLGVDDAFWLTDLYPDATALFEHSHAPLDEVVASCIVVLDANVLLLPFEFTKAPIAEVERVYTQLAEAGRLVVPGQAAREYFKHRSRKIAAIADAIDAAIGKAKKQIFEKQIPLLEDDEDYQAARELGAEMINIGKEVVANLEVVNERLQNKIGNDRVSSLYRKIFGSCVAEVDTSSQERKAIFDEINRRARLQIAPGFKDQNKEDGGVGDYLVWKAILQEGASRNVHCIFVTEEEKSDWWVKRQGTFQPRPELMDEYRRATGGKSIHLLPLSSLLSAFQADQVVVQQVQMLEEEKRESDVDFEPNAFEAFTHYLNESRQARNKALHDRFARLALIDDRIKRIQDINEKSGPSDYQSAMLIHELMRDRDTLTEDIRILSDLKPDELRSFDEGSKVMKKWLDIVNKRPNSF